MMRRIKFYPYLNSQLKIKKRSIQANQLNYDAIHDTVHEMCKDEARHGQAFAGLLKRFFGE